MNKFILLVMGLCAPVAFSQALSYVPAPRAVYISSDGTGNPGTWEPESGTASGTVSYVPQPVGAYCSNDGTGNEGTWVPCSVGGSGGSVSITSTDGSITFSPSTCTGTCTAIVNRALTLNTLTFTTVGEGITFPGGSQVFEDSTADINIQAPNGIFFQTESGLIQMFFSATDGTNAGSLLEVQGGTVGGQSVDSSVEVLNPDSYAMMKLSSVAGRLLNSSNARENQLGVGTASGGLPGTFAPRFAVGNALIAETEREINATAGALSAPAKLFNGSPVITGGTGTTTFPLFFLQPTGATAVTGFSTTGTFFGINAANGFTGNLIDLWLNGFHRFTVSAAGIESAVGYATFGNCSSAASPAVCSSSPTGSVVIAASATSVVVDTSAVTANSQILIQDDSSLGAKLSVTCNTLLSPPQVTARTAGTSFTISTAVTPSANPACYSYSIIN